MDPPPAPAVAEPAPALRPVRPPPATPVPADIDEWLPPETDPPPSAPPRPRAQAAAAPVPPPAAADEAIDAGGGGDDWTDYAQWAAMSADVHDDDAPADAPPPADDRRARILGMDWDELASTVAGCSACPLCRTRTRTVFGTGDRRARLMLVGEAPGRDEDLQGEPFVGQAGKLLNEMLRAIGLSRAEVYIANVLKCRPPQNRDPLPAEALACRAHLDRQIALVGPELIVALGRIPAHELLATQTQVGRLRGRWHRYGPAAIPLLVTYHPAYLLRSPAEKGKSLDDLERVLDVLEGRAAPDCGPDAS
ncbi:uracil-DNA glycosylase [Plasticicumulans sp.]|uniref:uracil-DNA glycosylase n=1 Tax=Plasticicumulans sp. TaxID=2307179 RepID=UPI002BF92C8D|nr:uracil-DNA glycosylase [Plasticicumulans sp.]HNM45310.1 uracil-DNA glycosylase [Plasticicumulans sp.]